MSADIVERLKPCPYCATALAKRDRMGERLEEALDTIEKLREALTNARKAIASLDEDALGWGQVAFTSPDDRCGRYLLRDELLDELDAALSSPNPSLRKGSEE